MQGIWFRRRRKMKKSTFYLLTFTWGLPLTLIGLIVGAALMIVGKKPEKWGACWHFKVGKNWGGLELGLIFLTDDEPSEHTKNHEHGHAIQNCYFGFFMPFVVCIPSAVRYWYRKLKYHRKGLTPPTKYDDVWFEGDASKLGTIYAAKWK